MVPEMQSNKDRIFCHFRPFLPFFEVAKDPVQYSNLSNEEWRPKRSLADNTSIIIEKADR